MPLYEYVCDACARRTEVIQPVKERKLTVCDDCGGHLTKAFSAPAIKFKGSGWYVTDYARGSKEKKDDSGADNKEEKASDASGGEKSEKGEKSEPSGQTSAKGEEKKESKKKQEKREGKKKASDS